MPRARSGTVHHKRHKRVMRAIRGHRGAVRRQYRLAKEALVRAGVYAYRDRRNFKRDIRSLWIIRLSAACRARGFSYSRFIVALRKANVVLNRKMLSELAISDPPGFDKVVETIRPFLATKAA
jgi:large subunit ribosomal protein L20